MTNEEDDWVENNIAPPAGLTYPEKLWCPECGIHARHQDNYGTSGYHVLLPLCPVCEDKQIRSEA